MGAEGFDFAFAHIERIPLAVEEDEPLGPLNVDILRADAIMQPLNRGPVPIQQPGSAFGT